MPRQAHQSAAKRFRSTGSFRGTSSVPKHGSLAAEVSPWPKIPSGLVSNRAPDAINMRSRGVFLVPAALQLVRHLFSKTVFRSTVFCSTLFRLMLFCSKLF